MKKIRVYELAKELDLESKVLVEFLIELGADVKSHMSMVEEDIANLVREHFTNLEESSKLAQSISDELEEDELIASRTKPKKKRSKDVEKKVDDDINKLNKKRKDKGNAKIKGQPKVKEMEIGESIVIKDLAAKIGVPAAEIIKKLIGLGVMATINQAIDYDSAALICAEYGITAKPEQDLDEAVFTDDVVDDPADLQPRPPVVTIMGHVDHGKTTLLDGIRKSKVTQTEAGGITQHIGAYQVEYKGQKITFLDTPGHAAFTAMRSRGAQVTDIAVLVVAADDGVMPQTVEAVNHAKVAGVPIIVAINKMDHPDANPDRIKQELSEHGLITEEWGGDTIFVEMSALKLEGIDELLEMILLVAEMEEYKANPNRPARGTVIEAQLDKGRGPVATVLITNGTLRIGDNFVVGNVSGKVRALTNEHGQNLKEAYPSQPVEIIGISDVPEAGDPFVVVETEQIARQVAELRQQKQREQQMRVTSRANLDDLFAQIAQGEVHELNLVIKADVHGSVEALRSSLEELSTDEVRVNVIHQGVGGVSETDVALAAASDAVIIAFNVRPESNARRAAEREKVEIRYYRVIYTAIEEVKAAMSGLLEPDYDEEVIGSAEVRQTFRVPGGTIVAGCYVTEGKIQRNAQIRVIRDNIIVHEGKISSLKRFKDDVREVAQGYECGIGVEKFNDIKDGDVLEAFIIKEIARSL
ncbi:MAG: translation initiation factor IF-2 [Firmicutes bacterium]|nr:translation initiation factor IF-2 [Bacillota bacterium]